MRKLGIAQAHTFLQDLIRGAALLSPNEDDYEKAVRRVLRYPDQDISLVDAINAEVAIRLGAQIWTYDHHFDIMDTSVWRA